MVSVYMSLHKSNSHRKIGQYGHKYIYQHLRHFESPSKTPKIIRSDNGSNFNGAQSVFKGRIEFWNKAKIQDHIRKKETK